MDNKEYEIRRDFMEGVEVLRSLADEDREQVEVAIADLAKNPWPRRVKAGTQKITIPTEDDEIVVLYEVNIFQSTVDLVKIKKRGPFKRAGEWLAGLTKFEPKGNS
jgi:mRNA-degrading endonuclease RelE of RelBE toxin-antitoxin system